MKVNRMRDRRSWRKPFCAGVLGVAVLMSVGCGDNGATGIAEPNSTQDQRAKPTASDSPEKPSAPAPMSTAASGPTLSGTPASTVTVGQSYSFQPVSTNSSGRILSFSIQNKPKWATFNTSTGQLSGVPQSMDGGTDSSIVISANDGVAAASLTAFAIQIIQSSTSRIAIAWTAPSENTDGAAANNLTGYRIYYGTSPTQLTSSIDVNSVGVLNYELTNLAPGTWYFAVAALNSDNVESNWSSIGNATI